MDVGSLEGGAVSGLERFRIVVAGIIVALWAAATIHDATSAGYDVPQNLQNVMMVVAGFLFTPAVIRAARKGGDDD